MIKKFEEFVNEGLISDYEKRQEEANKEISNSDKKFILEVIKAFAKIDLPFVFTCKNCAILAESVKEDKCDIDRNKIISTSELEDIDIADIHITENSIFKIFDKADDCVEEDYKKIWKDVWQWFVKSFEHMKLQWHGRLKVHTILKMMKEPIKKDLL